MNLTLGSVVPLAMFFILLIFQKNENIAQTLHFTNINYFEKISFQKIFQLEVGRPINYY